ncbi:GNAT family N-acetyltransferase [Pseudoroseomonas globiformis]|uniref:GNAT family N-acetyltransferase n=1 Tax=Teichococcus globiformis TaxID=2307229 RepID=A0ABV7G3U7_9PROT
MTTLHGARVMLRPWRADDRSAFATLNADPAVMRHFPAPLTAAESDGFMDRIGGHFAAHGYGFWAVELRNRPGAIGLCGLACLPWANIPWEAPNDPPVEIGWRLATPFHGKGLAREAAELSLSHGFGTLGLGEIVAFTAPGNAASWGLMERLGMCRAGEFDHPRLPEGHVLRRQVLYRLRREAWHGG